MRWWPCLLLAVSACPAHHRETLHLISCETNKFACSAEAPKRCPGGYDILGWTVEARHDPPHGPLAAMSSRIEMRWSYLLKIRCKVCAKETAPQPDGAVPPPPSTRPTQPSTQPRPGKQVIDTEEPTAGVAAPHLPLGVPGAARHRGLRAAG